MAVTYSIDPTLGTLLYECNDMVLREIKNTDRVENNYLLGSPFVGVLELTKEQLKDLVELIQFYDLDQ